MKNIRLAYADNLPDRRDIRLLFLRLFQVFLLAAVAWGAAVLALGYLIRHYPRQTLTIDSGIVNADVIIVLGGGRDERPQRAAELFKQGEAPRVLVSGYGDAQADVVLLEKNGVPADAIIREDQSVSTYENAEFAIPVLRKMGVHRAIIVTSWFHSRRALACFEHCAPDIQFYSRPSYLAYVPTAANQRDVDVYARGEYFKIVAYWAWYGIWPVFPG